MCRRERPQLQPVPATKATKATKAIKVNQGDRPDAYEIAEELAEERNIDNQYGQRDRFIEREAERIAKAQRQDRINQEARERAVQRHDEEFLEELDRTLQERYGPSGERL